MVRALKFANHRDAVAPMATMLAAAVDASVDLVTWVPTTASRRRSRGYDQAELLARAVARSLGVPARATVRRRSARSQTGAGRAERLTAAFDPLPHWRRGGLDGAAVAVVDDVRTTGASLAGVAVALRSRGAASVIGATLAATP